MASIEYLWRSSHTPLFVWLSVIGGVLLALAVLSTALLVLGAGSRLSVVGCVTLVVGWLTLFFGVGAILALAGFVLYVAGLVRTKVVERRSLYLALTLLAAAVAAALMRPSQVAAFELAAAAALAMGYGVVAGRAR